MKVFLIGAKLEENLGLRYMASSLELKGHAAEIIPFNEESDIPQVIDKLLYSNPDKAGLSMVLPILPTGKGYPRKRFYRTSHLWRTFRCPQLCTTHDRFS